MTAAPRALALAAALVAPAATYACSTELGELPARCPDGECPEGYECVNGVCARPGTDVPTTVERRGGLRAVDLRVVPQAGSVLVAWETYPYDDEGQSILARRLRPDGSTSAVMTLEDSFEADEVLLEPYFDLYAVSPTEILVALSAGPYLQGTKSRLRVFRATLPPEGREDEPTLREPAWPTEIEMPSIGYGAVSQPRFVRRTDGAIQLGYFQTSTTTLGATGATEGALAIFDLDPTGALAAPITCPMEPCCAAHRCLTAREGRSLAVGVVAAFAHDDRVTWVFDDVRPTAAVVGAMGLTEIDLPTLAVTAAADASGVLYIAPSSRQGEGLAADPVAGPARLGRASTGGDALLGELPEIRDTPKPAWVERAGKAPLLVTPGAAIDAPTLKVYTVDTANGGATEVAKVRRRASLPLGGLQAVLVGGKLYVVWIDAAPEEDVIRAAVLDEPP